MGAGAFALYAGLTLSGGFGEQRFSPAGRATVETEIMRLSASYEATKKLESSKGWIAGADLDFGKRVSLGVSYRFRDGGTWRKRSWWPRVGFQGGPAKIIIRHDLSTANSVTVGELELRASTYFHPVIGGGLFRDGSGRQRFGLFAQVWVGFRP